MARRAQLVGLTRADTVPLGVAAERIDRTHRQTATGVVTPGRTVRLTAVTPAGTLVIGADRAQEVRVAGTDVVPLGVAAERINEAHGVAACKVVTAGRTVRDAAAALAGTDRVPTDLEGLARADTVPRRVAAERVRPANDLAAGVQFATGRSVALEATALARADTAGARFVDARRLGGEARDGSDRHRRERVCARDGRVHRVTGAVAVVGVEQVAHLVRGEVRRAGKVAIELGLGQAIRPIRAPWSTVTGERTARNRIAELSVVGCQPNRAAVDLLAREEMSKIAIRDRVARPPLVGELTQQVGRVGRRVDLRCTRDDAGDQELDSDLGLPLKVDRTDDGVRLGLNGLDRSEDLEPLEVCIDRQFGAQRAAHRDPARILRNHVLPGIGNEAAPAVRIDDHVHVLVDDMLAETACAEGLDHEHLAVAEDDLKANAVRHETTGDGTARITDDHAAHGRHGPGLTRDVSRAVPLEQLVVRRSN